MNTDEIKDEILEESVLGKVGQKVRKTKDELDTEKYWNARKGKLKRGVFHSKKVSDADYKEIVECFDKMKKSEKYSEYKTWFDKMCRKCNIPIDGCIIQHYSFLRGKDNKNEVCITYSNTRQRITIPQGCELYHMTTYKGDIKELKPTFQGKAARGYLYSDPRVYLTIRKKMPKLCADLTPTTKTTLYRVKENIRTAYVDPLLPGYKIGAVYVQTNFPIPVEKVKFEPQEPKKVINETVSDIQTYEEQEVPNFVSLEEFVEYYGLQIVEDDEVIEESFASKIGSIERKLKDSDFIKKTWNELTSKIIHKDMTKEVKESDYKYLQENYDVLKTSKIYEKYKKAYENICKFFNLTPSETTIRSLEFKDGDKKTVTISYHAGKKKIVIPNGVKLIHTSANDNIKELEPKFCSKKSGMYLWPTRRVYFTLGKAIDQKKVGVDRNSKSFKYTPKETIKTAYIDSELPSYNMACIFVDTQFPIPVKNLTKETESKGAIETMVKKK